MKKLLLFIALAMTLPQAYAAFKTTGGTTMGTMQRSPELLGTEKAKAAQDLQNIIQKASALFPIEYKTVQITKIEPKTITPLETIIQSLTPVQAQQLQNFKDALKLNFQTTLKNLQPAIAELRKTASISDINSLVDALKAVAAGQAVSTRLSPVISNIVTKLKGTIQKYVDLEKLLAPLNAKYGVQGVSELKSPKDTLIKYIRTVLVTPEKELTGLEPQDLEFDEELVGIN